MQKYILCKVTCDTLVAEILMAEMGQLGYEGFIETENGFEAYLPEQDYHASALQDLLEQYDLSWSDCVVSIEEQQNWNALWESNFEPVIIDEKLRIRAPFHEADASFLYELVIQPKTSFGTGHHETTFTIMQLMLQKKWEGLDVFDYGSGTGILAILALKMGASSVFANDIDDWAAENIHENTALNGTEAISFQKGDISVAKGKSFDIILANINKNILMESFVSLRPLLKAGGILYISGFYESDLPDLLVQTEKCGFTLQKQVTTNGWTAACLS
jgi:ribosomal protein L11 methyltransferase